SQFWQRATPTPTNLPSDPRHRNRRRMQRIETSSSTEDTERRPTEKTKEYERKITVWIYSLRFFLLCVLCASVVRFRRWGDGLPASRTWRRRLRGRASCLARKARRCREARPAAHGSDDR